VSDTRDRDERAGWTASTPLSGKKRGLRYPRPICGPYEAARVGSVERLISWIKLWLHLEGRPGHQSFSVVSLVTVSSISRLILASSSRTDSDLRRQITQ
jgi:hypothetical protein